MGVCMCVFSRYPQTVLQRYKELTPTAYVTERPAFVLSYLTGVNK